MFGHSPLKSYSEVATTLIRQSKCRYHILHLLAKIMNDLQEVQVTKE